MPNIKIETGYDHPPIPDRRSDWSAVDGNTYDGAPDTHPPCPIGRGPTERCAVADLLEQLGCKDRGGNVSPLGTCLVCEADTGEACFPLRAYP